MKKAKILSAALSLTVGMTAMFGINTNISAEDIIPVREGSFSVESGVIEVVPGGSTEVILWTSQIATMKFISEDPAITVEPEFIDEYTINNHGLNTISIRCAEGAEAGKKIIKVKHTNYLSGALKEGTLEVNVVEKRSVPAIGKVSLDILSNGERRLTQLKGENLTVDDRYEITWDVSEFEGVEDVFDLRLNISNYEPFELGEKGKFAVEIEEIWLDGVKYDDGLAIQPVYRCYGDGNRNGKVGSAEVIFRNSENTDFSASETVKVVFTVSGLSSPLLDSGDIIGDINSDSRINAVDASMVLSCYAKLATEQDTGLDEGKLKAADVDKDGSVNAVDASKILSYYAQVAVSQ